MSTGFTCQLRTAWVKWAYADPLYEDTWKEQLLSMMSRGKVCTQSAVLENQFSAPKPLDFVHRRMPLNPVGATKWGINRGHCESRKK